MTEFQIYLIGIVSTFVFILFSDFEDRQQLVADNLFTSPHDYDPEYAELFLFSFGWLIFWPLVGLCLLTAYASND